MKPLTIIAIGIPGSGKTTVLTPLAEKYGMYRVSRDDIRQEGFGNPHVQDKKEETWLKAYTRTKEALDSGLSVILDSTFTDPDKRAQAIAAVREAGATRVIALLFRTPLDTAKERNASREFSVQNDVIEMMHEQIAKTPPHIEEGFDALYTDDQIGLLEERELAEKD